MGTDGRVRGPIECDHKVRIATERVCEVKQALQLKLPAC
jgi:hypothetical protein